MTMLPASVAVNLVTEERSPLTEALFTLMAANMVPASVAVQMLMALMSLSTAVTFMLKPALTLLVSAAANKVLSTPLTVAH